ncbi:hypothetical protein GQ43DRAFT_440858 [Delitschia confertaspora ATCC 74209]|uniref:Secreted protein n=1 Tax=Delitschia confertaspora ATCC 74209 TaxID=1513339 RepID=A0A9P4JQ18_9PLEO|nr:hypothetical protein GQ43DRAFT_440858 [Delitschia confertaspora ATCC 74209]
MFSLFPEALSSLLIVACIPTCGPSCLLCAPRSAGSGQYMIAAMITMYKEAIGSRALRIQGLSMHPQ